MPASGDQLLRLHEEFDLADAAAPKLEVMTLDRDLAMALIGMDLLLHRLHVDDGGEVGYLRQMKAELVRQRFPGAKVARANARP